MNNAVYKIAEGFNLKPLNISKTKYYYTIKTKDNLFLLRQALCDCKTIETLYALKISLIAKGFNNLDQYYISSQSTPYFYYDKSCYILTNLLSYPEISFENIQNVTSAITSLATMHNLSRGLAKHSVYDLRTIFNNGIKRLMQIKKTVSSKNHLSDLDVLFLRNYEYYYHLSMSALSILNSNNCQTPMSSFAHNSFKEQNLLLSPSDGVYITNWEQISNTHFTNDIVYFINRYIKKVVFPFNNINESLSLNDIITTYKSKNPLNTEEISILQSQLLFPTKYIDICDKYYMKQRSWAPISIINQLEGLIAQKDFYSDYISK